jgi:hypothetical protein
MNFRDVMHDVDRLGYAPELPFRLKPGNEMAKVAKAGQLAAVHRHFSRTNIDMTAFRRRLCASAKTGKCEARI